MKRITSPFYPYSSVAGDNFYNRVIEIDRISDRISQCAHSAVVGNPRVGKTSLLWQLATSSVFSDRVEDAGRFVVISLNCQTLGESASPSSFWKAIVNKAQEQNAERVQTLMMLLQEDRLDNFRISKAFKKFGETGSSLVVFLDEFDWLFNIPQFCSLDFIGGLHSIANDRTGLILVTASRLTVTQLNVLGKQKGGLNHGSESFNYLLEVPLAGLDNNVARSLLTKYLPTDASNEALLLAGRHPLLLQLGGQLLFEAVSHGVQPKDFPSLRETFLQQAEQHFESVWNYLNAKARLAILYLALHEIGKQIGKATFNFEEIEQALKRYEAEVRDMGIRGTLEMDCDNHNCIGSLAFRTWLARYKIPVALSDQSEEVFSSWLQDEQFLGIGLTNEEIKLFTKIIRSIPMSFLEFARDMLLVKAEFPKS